MDFYFAGGPYYIFHQINLALHENKGHPGDLIIADIFDGAVEIAQKIRTAKIFENVYLLDKRQSVLVSGIPNRTLLRKVVGRLGREFLNLPFILSQHKYKGFPFYGKQYRYIYTGLQDGFLNTFYVKQIKNGGKFFLVDDGLGDRTRHMFDMPLFYKIFSYFGSQSYYQYISGAYFYSLDCITGKAYYPFLEQIKPQPSDKEIFAKIFDYHTEDDQMLRYPFIYYTLGRTKEDYLQNEISLIRNAIGKSLQTGFALKMHPWDGPSISGFPLLESTLPFEVACLFHDMDNKVLIASHSAVLFNSKFIYDKEPYLIFMWKLIGIPTSEIIFSDLTLDQIVQHMLIDRYRNPKKIFIPESVEELVEILDKLSKILQGGSDV